MHVQGVQGGQVEGAAAGGGGESQDCPSAMAVHLERKLKYRTVVRKDRGAPNFTNKFTNNNTGVMDIIKVFEEISTSSVSSSSASSSSTGKNIKEGAVMDYGGLKGKRGLERDIFSSETYASPRKRRRTVRRESAVTGTPWTGWASRARPSSPPSSAGTTWSPRLGVPKLVTRGR